MQIEPGISLAHYEVVEPLGKGGMGEVYRARDTKLGRDVAIKVLPPDFTTDGERLARFDREARLLASMNHPHVASIYGLEESGETKFLVMELAAGGTIADRLALGPVPVDEAIAIARQIVDALESAHEKGIIHRDLKPANVMVDEEGRVKVLDFGLAKALDVEEGPDSGISNSPTMVRAATHAGVILGTAAYMSPEQAKGKRVDRRADIWAFGVVLFEMLTGRRMFEGETVSETLASVIKEEVPWDRLPKTIPASVLFLLKRCLAKDPKQRLQSIGEARIILASGDELLTAVQAPAESTVDEPRKTALVPWIVAAVLAIAVIALVILRPISDGEEPATPVGLAVLTQPVPGGVMSTRRGPAIAVSPDGQAMVFAAREMQSGNEGAGRPGMLWLRRTGDLAATPIAGTEGSRTPFFSPDGEWIGFFSQRALMKVAVTGGSPLTLCETDGSNARGGTWGRNGVIVFAPDWESGLVKVSEDGGEPQPVTTLEEAANERSHRWPHFLPDGRSVLYMVQIRGRSYDESHIKVVDLESGDVKLIMEGGSFPRYIPSGHLAWAKGNTLLVAAFDLEKLEVAGSPRPAVENVMSSVASEANDDGSAQYDCSDTGVLVYRTGGASARNDTLALLDRSGKVIARGSRKEQFRDIFLSPDGTQVAVVVGEGDVWIWDSARDTMSRLTFEGQAYSPVWTPDGRSIVYTSTRSGRPMLRMTSADGSGEPQDLIEGNTQQVWASSWSTDGRTLVANRFEKTFDMIAIPVTDGRAGEPVIIAGTPAAELSGKISPDSRWLAYMSDESGQMQVFVRGLSGAGGRWQVSEGTGFNPRWTRDGSEIVYRGEERQFYVVDVDTSTGAPSFGRSRLLFESAEIDPNNLGGWDAGPSIDRFAFVVQDEESSDEVSSVVIVTDWFERLKKLVPVTQR